jgi:ADP-dependent NAD(P)H-hydrate dehydratase / NAD(P)H-hydrate epimerase
LTEEYKHLNRILMGSRVAQIDRMAIDAGIDSKWLMKNAGTGMAREIVSEYKDAVPNRAPRGIIICGGGNNGGDGFVIALHLLELGYNIMVFHIVPPEKFSPDSAHYYNELKQKYPGSITQLDQDNMGCLAEDLENTDLIVDAVFGTGLHKGPIRQPALDIIKMINDAAGKNEKTRVYSVDIPSGIDSDNGRVLGEAVFADRTITFGCKKAGNVNYPGAAYNGRVSVIDIGIPGEYFGRFEQIFEPTLEWAADVIPSRESWTYKHRVGKLMVAAGSLGFTGAAAMTCMGALRAGAGLVTLVCPEELNGIMEEKLTEVITYPVQQTDMAALDFESLEDILELSRNMDAAAIGPGISRDAGTIHLVRELIKRLNIPVVLDADGLQALAGPHEIGEDNGTVKADLVITPHAGELSSIMGMESIDLSDRLDVNLEASKRFGAISVLKGAATVTTGIDEGLPVSYINPTGNWGMASAGTGDILTGIIGSLLCQGMKPLPAAACGVYIHGLAADIMSKKTSRTSLVATDLLEGIKEVFLKIEKIKYRREK